MKTLYRWSLVLFIIRDLHKCRSRLCIADRVMVKLRAIDDNVTEGSRPLKSVPSMKRVRERKKKRRPLTSEEHVLYVNCAEICADRCVKVACKQLHAD